MSKSITDQLKKNKRPLILMNSELQNAMLSMPPKEFVCLQDTSDLNDPQWKAKTSDKWYVSENLYNVFQLRLDYAEEQQIVEREITFNETYGVWGYESPLDSGSVVAESARSCRGFRLIGFKYEDGWVSSEPVGYVNSSGVRYEGSIIAQIKNGVITVLHATHVLFRRQT